MGLEDIFRAYDVRGVVPDELDEEVMEEIGRAFGTVLQGRGEDEVLVGRDVRESSPELAGALVRGLTSTGLDVVDAGMVPYGPVLFHGRENELPSAYVTASHLPGEYNGVKFAHPDGTGYTEEENGEVEDTFFDQEFSEGEGAVEEVDVLPAYTDHLLESVDIEDINVLMDVGSGAASVVAPDIFWSAGVRLEVMNGDPDGSFPNRSSNVTRETLSNMMGRMEEEAFDLGVAYDGDADRVALVDDEGRLLSAEQAAYIALDHLLKEGDTVIANVECSRIIEDVAGRHGAEVVRTRVGHSYLFREVVERNAVLGVEKARHMAVSDIFPLDDGIAVSLYLAALVSKMERPLSKIVDEIPSYERERIPFDADEGRKFEVVEELARELEEEFDDTNRKDGIRVELEDGWILIRASNTSPKIRLTVEAETREDFEELEEEFSDLVEAAITATR